MIQTIPGASCGCYRGSIVDRSTRKESKTFVGEMDQEPRVGKIRAAKTLKKKITEMAWATSFSLA